MPLFAVAHVSWLDMFISVSSPDYVSCCSHLAWYLYWVPLFWLYFLLLMCFGLIWLLMFPILTIFSASQVLAWYVYWVPLSWLNFLLLRSRLDMFIVFSFPDYISCCSGLGLICLLCCPFLTIFPVAQVLAWYVYWVSLSWLYFPLLRSWLDMFIEFPSPDYISCCSGLDLICLLCFPLLTIFPVARVLTWLIGFLFFDYIIFCSCLNLIGLLGFPLLTLFHVAQVSAWYVYCFFPVISGSTREVYGSTLNKHWLNLAKPWYSARHAGPALINYIVGPASPAAPALI